MKHNSIKKIYISAPLDLLDREGIINKTVDKIYSKTNIHPTYWKFGDVYDKDSIYNNDAIIFILPGLKFKAAVKGSSKSRREYPVLSSGVAKELLEAVNHNKKIYVLYKTVSSSIWKIYDAKSDGYYIEGIPGTVDNIFKSISIVEKETTKWRFKTYEEFEATCDKDSFDDYKAGDTYFTSPMFYLFGEPYIGSPDNLIDMDGWHISKEMIVPIEHVTCTFNSTNFEPSAVDNNELDRRLLLMM